MFNGLFCHLNVTCVKLLSALFSKIQLHRADPQFQYFYFSVVSFCVPLCHQTMVHARSRVQTGDGCSFIFQMRILYFVTRLASSGGVQAGSRQEVGALLSGPTISTPPNLPQLHQPGLLFNCLDSPHLTPLLGTIRTQIKDIEIYKNTCMYASPLLVNKAVPLYKY